MVTAYLEVAELQALNRKPMYMQHWLQRVDDFLQMTGNDILTHSGTISHQQALNKAKEEYTSYKESLKNERSKAEQDFVKHLEQSTEQLKRRMMEIKLKKYDAYKDSGVK